MKIKIIVLFCIVLLSGVLALFFIEMFNNDHSKYLKEIVDSRDRINLIRFNETYNGIPCNDSFKYVWMECDEYSCPCFDLRCGFSSGIILCGQKQSEESCKRAMIEFYEKEPYFEGTCKPMENNTELLQCAVIVKKGKIDWENDTVNYTTIYCEYWNEVINEK